jgi:putative molybdopterin biosynthesis protein
VATEQYDLIVPSDILDDPKIQLLINLIRSEDFRKRVKALGGYDANMSGNLWKII